MKFYTAEGPLAERLRELAAERERVLAARQALLGRVGASGSVTQGQALRGLVFAADPGRPWRLSRKLVEGLGSGVPGAAYLPDNSGEGRALRRELEGLRDPADTFRVASILGVQPVFMGRYTPAQFTVLCGRVVVGLDDRIGTPADCQRISDVEYEELLARANAGEGAAGSGLRRV